jgi:hypothetical protein
MSTRIAIAIAIATPLPHIAITAHTLRTNIIGYTPSQNTENDCRFAVA